MDENKEFIPSLTLDPNAASASAVAAELGVDEPKAPVLEEKKDVPVEKLELERLSPAEQAAVKEFAKQIDVTNSEQVLNYGSAAQKNIADFSDAALSKVRTKDLGEVGEEAVEVGGVDDDARRTLLQTLVEHAEEELELAGDAGGDGACVGEDEAVEGGERPEEEDLGVEEAVGDIVLETHEKSAEKVKKESLL